MDALGNLAHFLLLPGQRHDSVGAEPLLDGIEIGALIADKGFDNDVLPVVRLLSSRPNPIACARLRVTSPCTAGVIWSRTSSVT